MSPDACRLSSATGSVELSPFFAPSGPRLRAALPTDWRICSGSSVSRATAAEDGFAQPFDFSFRHAEFERDLPLAVGKRSGRFQAEREVGGRQHVGASSGARQLVNLEARHCGVHLLTTESRHGQDPEVGTGAPDRSGPTRRRSTSAAPRPCSEPSRPCRCAHHAWNFVSLTIP